ncbi:glycogen debranching protein GlgX [Mesorhizobium sp. CAU 1741]|uniref:glycogen debranching protein GlgX n=1 Tax=Mesorhizobium sp. CAU 1741 TaxID=3140366 RepID=UPI00325AD4FB
MSEGEHRAGAYLTEGGASFSVWSGAADRVWLCLFDENADETKRLEMGSAQDGWHTLFVPGLSPGARYGFRADGPYDPDNGLWFDPDKLLVDPYALELNRAYRYDPALAAPRGTGPDTARLMPKAIVRDLPVVPLEKPRFSPGGLIYELNVRGFTMLHPEVPDELRGTIAALAHPAIIEHLRKLHVDAVELMPITAWMDERHLPPLGLSNAWGYNPVTFMALDPRLAPGGWREMRETVAALHEAGIGVILDLVFNHTAESDRLGPTLSLRGLGARAYFRHCSDGELVNDTGTGNTVACDHPATRRLVLDSLRAFVRHAGIDGFRFDLAPILGRNDAGFDPGAPLLQEMLDDPEIGSRILIAEPWDIGPGGYQLGNFAAAFLEWNDQYRDDVRRFVKGEGGGVARLATRLAGSADVFTGAATRSVNFIAAHDGMTLADLTAYEHKHNEANGEDNRDGHNDNISWNHGVEGPSDAPDVVASRLQDIKTLLTLLFASRGAIMLTAGDEFGRTQGGNNNAYAQDNAITWLDWTGRDQELEAHAFALGALRAGSPQLRDATLLTDQDVQWLREDGQPMTVADWEDDQRRTLTMALGSIRLTIDRDGARMRTTETKHAQ